MKKTFLLFPLFFLLHPVLRAQVDSTVYLEEVVISGFQPNDPKYTSLNIEPYTLKTIERKAPLNLTDALAKLPGISQMTTGNSISKPIIRGLYGNRILVLLSGLRFDNQQWQDEHGLGLSQAGIDRVEIIKGPASLLYGSEALGGVINIIEEKPEEDGKKFDFGSQMFSNSLGMMADAGYSARNNGKWWRLRIGGENQADYSDGNGVRILNSRNGGYFLKAGMGFKKKKWEMENSYHFSYNKFGFILEDLNTLFTPDDRWSRKIDGPHHNVLLNLLNSQSTFYLKSSLLKLNVGLQSNLRQEDEGGGQISLNMHLFSALQNLRWEKDLSPKVTFIANHQFSFTNNTNFGGRILIPDANMIESNLSGYLKAWLNKWILESGIGVNYRNTKTFLTKTLNAPGEPIQPFSKNDFSGNAMMGLSFNPTKHVTLKTNASTGFRSPNLAELSSNGLHEGVYRYEIGDPDLKVEQNVNTDLSLEINKNASLFSASVYYNQFVDYVYLAPTTDVYFGFPVYRFQQQNAEIHGTELFFRLEPKSLNGFYLKETLAMTRGQLNDGSNLPFIPAYKTTSSPGYEKDLPGKIKNIFIEPELIYTFKQDKPAQFETSTGSYFLINVSAGITIAEQKGDWILNINATNLTNKPYADHLSRLKDYGLLNEGLNIIFNVRKEIKW